MRYQQKIKISMHGSKTDNKGELQRDYVTTQKVQIGQIFIFPVNVLNRFILMLC